MDEFEIYQGVSKALGFSDYSPLLIQYGGIAALENILRSGELWFGDLDGMNDGSECNHFIDAIHSSLEEVVPVELVSLVRSLINEHRASLKSNSFASSWCEYTPDCRGGDNTMWQTYSDPENPVAFIIDSSQFMPSQINAKRKDFFIFSSRVSYVRSDRAAGLLRQDLLKLKDIGLLTDTKKNGVLIALLLLAKAPAIKHETWRSEQEIRFLFSPALLKIIGKEIPSLKYQQGSKNGIVRTNMRFPLKEYQQFDFDFSMRRILKQVLVGPSRNQSATELAVRGLLKRYDLQSVEVVKSDSPLRR
jgi:Protein of unknown function (DUF2971)